jgi:hypothetical protein
MHATKINDSIYSERWHLATLSRDEMMHLLFLSLIGGLMFIIVTSEAEQFAHLSGHTGNEFI